MRRLACSAIIAPAVAPGAQDAYCPFSDDSRLWKIADDKEEAKQKKNPRLSLFFRVATEELKALPSVNAHADSRIIRAANMVMRTARPRSELQAFLFFEFKVRSMTRLNRCRHARKGGC